MRHTLKALLADESGAVTVDWVVLTAAVVALGILVIAMVLGGSNDLAGDISRALADAEVNTLTGLETVGSGLNE